MHTCKGMTHHIITSHTYITNLVVHHISHIVNIWNPISCSICICITHAHITSSSYRTYGTLSVVRFAHMHTCTHMHTRKCSTHHSSRITTHHTNPRILPDRHRPTRIFAFSYENLYILLPIRGETLRLNSARARKYPRF